MELAKLIESLPDEAAYLDLLSRYNRILHKYAVLLNYEDSYEDLQLFFLSLVYSMRTSPILQKGEGVIVNYIISSIKHQYIALSKKQKNLPEDNFSSLSDEQLTVVERISAEEDPCDISAYYPAKEKLTDKETFVIKELFVEGFSVQEIAHKNNISRQAINQLKLRALEKIRRSTDT